MIINSPRNNAAIISFIVLLFSALLFVINDNVNLTGNWLIYLFIALALYTVVYICVYLTFRYCVITKIKPIYDLINEISIPENEIVIQMEDKDVFPVIQKEVEQWIKKTIKENTELKKSDKYRKEFVSNVAHELKTPIFNIQGYILTLLDGGLEDKNINKKYLKRANKNIERLISTIRDVDTVGQLESGIVKIMFESFNVVGLINDVFEIQEVTAERYKINLQFMGDFDNEIFVIADKGRIFEVLNNLIVNAIKYGKPGGICKVSINESEEKVFVEVADNGIGISEEHLSDIFKRFYRVDKSRSRERGGSGLGLAIIKHIIEGHDEDITVDSRENVGSTFTFSLQKENPYSDSE